MAAALARIGMSEAEAARQIGVTRAAINLWLKGERRPRPVFWKAIRKTLGVNCARNGKRG